MIHIKELLKGAKGSKKGLFELIVGIWTFLLLILLVVLLVTGIDFLTKKSKETDDKNQGDVVEETVAPEPTVTPTDEPEIEDGGEEKEEDDEEEEENVKEENLKEENSEKDNPINKKKDEEDKQKVEGEETLYVTTLVNMRSSASLNASILTKLSQGSVVIRIKKLGDGWSKIYYDGKEGYVKTEYLSKTRPDGKASTNTTGNSSTVVTPKPTSKPVTPKKTQKPANTPKPTATPKNDAAKVKVTEPPKTSDDESDKTESPDKTEPPSTTEMDQSME